MKTPADLEAAQARCDAHVKSGGGIALAWTWSSAEVSDILSALRQAWDERDSALREANELRLSFAASIGDGGKLFARAEAAEHERDEARRMLEAMRDK